MKILKYTLALLLLIGFYSCQDDDLGIDTGAGNDTSQTTGDENKNDDLPSNTEDDNTDDENITDNGTDTDFEINETTLIGQWKVLSGTNEHITIHKNENDLKEHGVGYGEDFDNVIYTFNEDKTFTITGEYTDVYVLKVNDVIDDYRTGSDREIIDDIGTWEMEDSTLKILPQEYLEYNDPAEEYEVTVLGDNKIKFYHYYFSETSEYSEMFEYIIILEKI